VRQISYSYGFVSFDELCRNSVTDNQENQSVSQSILVASYEILAARRTVLWIGFSVDNPPGLGNPMLHYPVIDVVLTQWLGSHFLRQGKL